MSVKYAYNLQLGKETKANLSYCKKGRILPQKILCIDMVPKPTKDIRLQIEPFSSLLRPLKPDNSIIHLDLATVSLATVVFENRFFKYLLPLDFRYR